MTGKHFEEIYTQGKIKVMKMIRDNQTSVLYLPHQEGYRRGLTVMFDQDGKPLVDEHFKRS